MIAKSGSKSSPKRLPTAVDPAAEQRLPSAVPRAVAPRVPSPAVADPDCVKPRDRWATLLEHFQNCFPRQYKHVAQASESITSKPTRWRGSMLRYHGFPQHMVTRRVSEERISTGFSLLTPRVSNSAQPQNLRFELVFARTWRCPIQIIPANPLQGF